MKLNDNIRIEEDDAGIWIILCEQTHEFISRPDARALKRYLERVLKKKPVPRKKRQRQ